jgi:hypothetical protein
MPDEPGLVLLALSLEDLAGNVLQRNFTTFLTTIQEQPRDLTMEVDGVSMRALRFAPGSFAAAQWSRKQWNVLDGLKVNGAGSGFFEYRIPWPDDLDPAKITGATLLFEASAKELLGKDKEGATKQAGDFMLGKGTHDPGLNQNAYPMTDARKFPSAVRVLVSGTPAGTFELPDDPADHRGILSWYSQKRDRYLREAGSYGYLIQANLSRDSLRAGAESGQLVIRLEVDSALPGGLAIYGEHFGRYPLDPTVLFVLGN